MNKPQNKDEVEGGMKIMCIMCGRTVEEDKKHPKKNRHFENNGTGFPLPDNLNKEDYHFFKENKNSGFHFVTCNHCHKNLNSKKKQDSEEENSGQKEEGKAETESGKGEENHSSEGWKQCAGINQTFGDELAKSSGLCIFRQIDGDSVPYIVYSHKRQLFVAVECQRTFQKKGSRIRCSECSEASTWAGKNLSASSSKKETESSSSPRKEAGVPLITTQKDNNITIKKYNPGETPDNVVSKLEKIKNVHEMKAYLDGIGKSTLTKVCGSLNLKKTGTKENLCHSIISHYFTDEEKKAAQKESPSKQQSLQPLHPDTNLLSKSEDGAPQNEAEKSPSTKPEKKKRGKKKDISPRSPKKAKLQIPNGFTFNFHVNTHL
jgi:DNA-directed RNA polymerase subunit RPC12/RpoP